MKNETKKLKYYQAQLLKSLTKLENVNHEIFETLNEMYLSNEGNIVDIKEDLLYVLNSGSFNKGQCLLDRFIDVITEQLEVSKFNGGYIMNKKDLNELIKISNSLGWNIEINKNEFEFSFTSPEGQEFTFEVTADTVDELIEEVFQRYNNFDCSSETMLWLDSDGHGKKGAPSDMKTIYEDMESCQQSLNELYENLSILMILK